MHTHCTIKNSSCSTIISTHKKHQMPTFHLHPAPRHEISNKCSSITTFTTTLIHREVGPAYTVKTMLTEDMAFCHISRDSTSTSIPQFRHWSDSTCDKQLAPQDHLLPSRLQPVAVPLQNLWLHFHTYKYIQYETVFSFKNVLLSSYWKAYQQM